MSREASCSCGQLHLEVEGDPVRISICHCLACQRRTGSAFAIQARFATERVRVHGRFQKYVRIADHGGERRSFRFCPDCGGTVFFTSDGASDLIAVPVGAFADPSFPAPTVSVYGSRRHPWVTLPEGVQTDEAWASLSPLYEAGEFAEAADRGRELIEAHPDQADLLYNIACCESLAGRADDAIAHLRTAIERSTELRAQAAGDSDFDPIRERPGFSELVGG